MAAKDKYVSLETALLLKELGFDVEVIGSYDLASNGQLMISGTLKKWNYNAHKYTISAPTLEEAASWLSSKYNIQFIDEHGPIDSDIFNACQLIIQNENKKTYLFDELSPEAQDNAIFESTTAYTTFIGAIPYQVHKDDIAQLLRERKFPFYEDGTPVKDFD